MNTDAQTQNSIEGESSMDMKNIGTIIETHRKLNKLTQQQLADKLGITNKAVSKWETGQGLPDISIIPRSNRSSWVDC